MASCPGDQGVMESGGCTETGLFSQSLWEQRVPDVSMGWGWSASKNELVQGLSYVWPSSAVWKGQQGLRKHYWRLTPGFPGAEKQ